jgi:hypothetical protein
MSEPPRANGAKPLLGKKNAPDKKKPKEPRWFTPLVQESLRRGKPDAQALYEVAILLGLSAAHARVVRKAIEDPSAYFDAHREMLAQRRIQTPEDVSPEYALVDALTDLRAKGPPRADAPARAVDWREHPWEVRQQIDSLAARKPQPAAFRKWRGQEDRWQWCEDLDLDGTHTACFLLQASQRLSAAGITLLLYELPEDAYTYSLVPTADAARIVAAYARARIGRLFPAPRPPEGRTAPKRSPPACAMGSACVHRFHG